VHLLIEVDPPYGVDQMSRSMKGRGSIYCAASSHHWPPSAHLVDSFLLSTVGGSPRGALKQHIENQKRSEH
jgi:REP element-mobilizing transposase RayT